MSMKKKKQFKLIATGIMLSCILGASVQKAISATTLPTYLYLNLSTGTKVQMKISDLQEITFVQGEMTMLQKNQIKSTFSTSQINFIDFGVNDISSVIGISDQKKLNLILYPNPVADKLCFSIIDTGIETVIVQIINLAGQLVLEKRVSDANSISVADLLPGIYVCKVSYNNKNEINKFIKI